MQVLDWLDSLSRKKFVYVLVVAAIIGLLIGIFIEERERSREVPYVEEPE